MNRQDIETAKAEYAKALEKLKRIAPELAEGFPEVSGNAPPGQTAETPKKKTAAKETGARGYGSVFKQPRSNFWWIRYWVRGKPYRESAKTTDREKAEEFLRFRMKQKGADQLGYKKFVGPDQERVRVNTLMDGLAADYRLRRVMSPQVESRLRSIREAFGDYKAVQLTSRDVDRYIESRLDEGYAPATVNRETQLLGQAFRMAIEKDQLTNAPKIRRLSEKDNARTGFFEKRDFEALLEQLPDYLRDFATFGYLTGWRKSEIASLLWSDLDLDARLIILRGTEAKNGHSRKVPLEGELWELTERRWNARSFTKPDGTVAFSAYVFHRNGRAIGDFKKAWHSACKKVGLAGKLFHDFRRTASRNMRRAGNSEKAIMEITGHRTTSMFLRYSITDERDLREAMQKTQQYLKTISSEKNILPFQKAAAGGAE